MNTSKEYHSWRPLKEVVGGILLGLVIAVAMMIIAAHGQYIDEFLTDLIGSILK
jgi:ABC-type nitrate/sulfonate/bicarbonate transport system permease component